jgi:hypothetical protein
VSRARTWSASTSTPRTRSPPAMRTAAARDHCPCRWRGLRLGCSGAHGSKPHPEADADPARMPVTRQGLKMARRPSAL